MVFVKGGEYTMGGYDMVNDGGVPERRMADECPHTVRVEDFYIGKYEVTQSDWKEIMGTIPGGSADCGDCPVNEVSWNDIQEFIKKLPAKFAENYRLPSEQEWEFAAKGGVKSNDFMYSGSDRVHEVGWFADNSGEVLHPVGMLQPNELGIYDMSGNIWEWCSDFKTPYPCDFIGKTFDSRVLRGGTYRHSKQSLRVRDRNGRDPSMRLPTLGFRLAI